MSITLEIAAGKFLELQGDQIVIGHGDGCHVVLPDALHLLPQHAELRKVANRWLVEARGDAQIAVGGNPSSRLQWLHPGDTIWLSPGGPKLVFQPQTEAQPDLQTAPPSGQPAIHFELSSATTNTAPPATPEGLRNPTPATSGVSPATLSVWEALKKRSEPELDAPVRTGIEPSPQLAPPVVAHLPAAEISPSSQFVVRRDAVRSAAPAAPSPQEIPRAVSSEQPAPAQSAVLLPPPLTAAEPVGEFAILPEEPVEFAWWQGWLGNSQSFMVSMAVHVCLLLALAMLTTTILDPQIVAMVLESRQVNEEQALLQADVSLSQFTNSLSATNAAPSAGFVSVDGMGLSMTDSLDLESLPVTRIIPEQNIAVNKLELMKLPTEIGLMQNFGIGDPLKGSEIGPIRDPLRSAVRPDEAVNGVASEIVEQLGTGSLLVVWMFDASLSMRKDRKDAAKRIGKILKEINDRMEKSIFEVRHAALAFGAGSKSLQLPTTHYEDVVPKISRIPDDESGREFVLTALLAAIPHYRKNWTGRIQFVIWTDESGDDTLSLLDNAIAYCKQERISVSVIGPSACLGRPKGFQFFQNQRTREWWYLMVDRGPDAGVKDLIQIPHWFPAGLGSNHLPNSVSSGLPPYGLMRLTRETGGTFTVYDRPEDQSEFQVERLQEYLPDYRDVATIERESAAMPLRKAVMDACGLTYPIPVRGPPVMTDDFEFWFPAPEYQQRIKNLLTGENGYVTSVAPAIENALNVLNRTELEAAYQKETSLRWKACYDLALGRLLAMSVRHREYDMLCTQIIRGAALQPNTTKMYINPSPQLASGEWGLQRAAAAKKYLERCVSNNPGTPWAKLANYELEYELGFSISQRETVPAGVAGPPTIRSAPPSL